MYWRAYYRDSSHQSQLVMAESNGSSGASTAIVAVVGIIAILIILWFVFLRGGNPESIDADIDVNVPEEVIPE